MSIGNTSSKIESSFSKDYIDLGNLNLFIVPDELRKLKHLKRINLSSNSIKSLPDWFQEFENLEILDLRSCELDSLCNGFEKLQNLHSLYLRHNNFTEVPPQLKFMPHLRLVFLSHNSIQSFPYWFFQIPSVSIEGNPIVDPPEEVCHRGIEAIVNYFKEREKGTESLNEAKLLIVGEPGAGKTTLMNKIINEDFLVNPFLPSTKGIEIRTFYFQTNNKDNFRVNIWDFGGQEIYHATHQFFLTKRSLYILLSDNRAEDTDFNYWLQTIELLSESSPIIIVQNERYDRKKDLSEKGMREKYKAIKQIVNLNIGSQSNSRLRYLVETIKQNIVSLPHIGTELPKIWVDIRKALEEKATSTPYINEKEYFDICTKFGMSEKERANFLSDYLHDLGVFLHFKDNSILKRWIILRPEWGTEAVYKVLDNETVIAQKGYFSRNDLKSIWDSNAYSDMHDELISLMKKFELCYQLEGEDVLIAAQLLDRDRPAFTWDKTANLRARYDYAFMPKGIITRFIVKMHYYITDQKLVWREGVILERQNTKAEIIEIYGENSIRIRVHGKNKKEFLAIILDTLDKIHSSYSKINVTKLIPCNCEKCRITETPYLFNYEEIRKFIDNDILDDRCRVSLNKVDLLPLIDDAFGNNIEFKAAKPLVYLSYCSIDRPLKLDLEKHLSLLEKTSGLQFFDRDMIRAGSIEKKELREHLDIADIIILLVSANYISDEWNYNSEMIKAIDRSDTGSCLTIPVIITDCTWQLLPLIKFKPVTYKEQPLFSYSNKEESLSSAVYNIKNSIEEFLNKRNKNAENRTSQDVINQQVQRDSAILDEYMRNDNPS